MARIRTIKPDFWTDGTMVQLSPYARLFYIGTWNFALCDRGHLADDANGLKLKILPADPVDATELMNELLARGRLERRTMRGGRTYLFIPRLAEHQKVDARWASRCPFCLEESGATASPDPVPDETPPNSGEFQGVPDRAGESAETPADSPQERKGKESNNPPTPQRGKSRRPSTYDDDPGFQQFWDAYPLKKGKPSAFKAWKAAIARGADPRRVIDAATSYRDDPRRKPDFTKHPGPWLNDERYNDQPAAGRRVAAGPGGAWWDN